MLYDASDESRVLRSIFLTPCDYLDPFGGYRDFRGIFAPLQYLGRLNSEFVQISYDDVGWCPLWAGTIWCPSGLGFRNYWPFSSKFGQSSSHKTFFVSYLERSHSFAGLAHDNAFMAVKFQVCATFRSRDIGGQIFDNFRQFASWLRLFPYSLGNLRTVDGT
jgi:hypothetical protein